MAFTDYAVELLDDLEEMLPEQFSDAVVYRTDEPALPLLPGKLHLILGQPKVSFVSSEGGVITGQISASISLYFEGITREEVEDVLSEAADNLAQFLAHAPERQPCVVDKWESVKDITFAQLAPPAHRRGQSGYMRTSNVNFTVRLLKPSV